MHCWSGCHAPQCPTLNPVLNMHAPECMAGVCSTRGGWVRQVLLGRARRIQLCCCRSSHAARVAAHQRRRRCLARQGQAAQRPSRYTAASEAFAPFKMQEAFAPFKMQEAGARHSGSCPGSSAHQASAVRCVAISLCLSSLHNNPVLSTGEQARPRPGLGRALPRPAHPGSACCPSPTPQPSLCAPRPLLSTWRTCAC